MVISISPRRLSEVIKVSIVYIAHTQRAPKRFTCKTETAEFLLGK